MSGAHVMKRIPRIKFPQRHPKPQGSSPAADQNVEISRSGFTSQPKAPSSSAKVYRFRSEVPAPPTHTGVGGKASMLPKRTPVSDKEIEAIMLGGCF
ncbi:uncharacterized protein LOC109828862 [Asparagus officinalis]|uniref:uncharacterized protein LOC109828862 n=1 Tax=Asparagus officinalis TaxID=4686 RepID=UPI00098DED1A|nr:uncharacterized protein LOC109828862 [Asparagus officinalis]